MQQAEIVFTNEVAQNINEYFEKGHFSKLILLVDKNTSANCLPVFSKKLSHSFFTIEIKPGEKYKNIYTLQYIWEELVNLDADRNSLLVNIGGGVLCDIGGFAAATFKRGIAFLNIPTTLLAQVDASFGGKTGFDFMGLKNEIGMFVQPIGVLIYSGFLCSLPKQQILSGFAEMIKHALIFDSNYLDALLKYDINDDTIFFEQLSPLIQKSIVIKNSFIEADPMEKGVRKVLNFGHTIGHGLESYYLGDKQELLHGEAIALGMIAELFLSKSLGFPESDLNKVIAYIIKFFHKPDFDNLDFEKLFDLMIHDKKNLNGKINFVLLSKIADFKIDVFCEKDNIFEALTFLKNM